MELSSKIINSEFHLGIGTVLKDWYSCTLNIIAGKTKESSEYNYIFPNDELGPLACVPFQN
jgi:hypothetical protein